MNNLYFFIFLLFSNTIINSFNISNINKVAKKKILDNLSLLGKGYFINKLQNETSSELKINSNLDYDHKNEINTNINIIDNKIYFYSEVNEESSIMLESKLINLNNDILKIKKKYNYDNGPIKLHIQSMGGSLFHTLYLIDLIKNLNTPVHTYVDGFAASAATLLVVAGKRKFMTKNSLMLIHQLSGGLNGKYSEMKDESENIDTLMNIITDFYLQNTNFDKITLNSLLKRDLWLTSNKCKFYGLIDEII